MKLWYTNSSDQDPELKQRGIEHAPMSRPYEVQQKALQLATADIKTIRKSDVSIEADSAKRN